MAAHLRRTVSSRLPDLTALALVAVTVLAGTAVLPRLPAEMIVGVHVGLDGQVSLTRGPRILGQVLIPAHAVGLFVLATVTRHLAAIDGTERRLFDLAVNLLLALLCAAQGYLLWLNL